jgi:hypothetical protein
VTGFNSLSPLSTVLLHWVHSGLSSRTGQVAFGMYTSLLQDMIEFVGRHHDWLLHFTVLGCVEALKMKTASQDLSQLFLSVVLQ